MTSPHSLVDWTKVAEWLGKSWRWITAIFLVTLLFLVLPESVLSRLGVCDLVHNYHSVLLIACFLTGAFLLTHPLSGIYRLAVPYVKDTWTTHVGKKHLHKLNPDEKGLCRVIVQSNGSPLHHNLANGAIQSLLSKGVLIKPVQGWPGGLYDFNVQPWALEYLREHPELLAD